MNNILSVKELTTNISKIFLKNFNNNFIVKGEVFSVSNKGHIWFTLKDLNDNCIINCVIWKTIVENENIDLDIGDIIIARGKIKLYDVQNRYNLCIYKLTKKETIENSFKKKLKLYKEKGYYIKNNILDKKKIKKIALITSLEGEAINDFKKTIENRFFFGKIYTKDVNVQGENCVSSINNAIDFFEKKVDVILITRGGGSFLDLNEFNNDLLIEKIYNCKTPIYCAIGHERDYTICDYVCDLRSSTPTSLALEISYDKNILHNKFRLHYENELKKYSNFEKNIIKKLDEIKNNIYDFILKNKPSGFFIEDKYIEKLSDFKKLCNEKFKIKLLDCEIEFKINNYNILKEYNSKYTYDKYLEIYKKPSNIKNKLSLNEYIDKFNNNKNFGEKNNFIICKKLLNILNNYYNNIDKINNQKIEELYFDNFIKDDNIELSLEKLKKYKKHINYLNKYKSNNNDINNDTNINSLFQKFIKYNEKDGINQNFLLMYNKLSNYNIIYKKY